MKQSFWFNKKVLVTGHTGFKGGWLSLWLNNLGANVAGFALQPTVENVFYSSIFKDGMSFSLALRAIAICIAVGKTSLVDGDLLTWSLG